MAPQVFTGALMPKKKQELQEIAGALNISDQGTKDDIMNRIKRHLELNPDLEEDPSFAGLFGNRRKRSVQPQIPTVQSLPKPNSRGRRVIPLEPVRESTPVNDLRDVSMFLKNPLSPFENTPQQSPRQAIDITPSSLPPLPESPTKTSPAKSIIEHLATSKDVQVLKTKIKDTELLQNSLEVLEQIREFLSNSRNVWSATAVVEYIYIIYSVIPWKTGKVPLFQLKDTPVALPYFYPPLSTFQTYAFWLVLLHWALPTVILPIIAGSLISFTPKTSSQPATPEAPFSQTPFDPLTAAIIRLAVHANYPYASVAVQGADVLGWNWRVWNAAVGLLFAFSEKLGGSPQATAQIIQTEQRKEQLQLEAEASSSLIQSPSVKRRALMSSAHDEVGDEVD
ncbi:hypothetical protein H0H87_000252 [Tephrocybe sp. NHM501043]|nr:hypothetical protein H0H87_000252 [Tephrocybe sp. NHM501043]